MCFVSLKAAWFVLSITRSLHVFGQLGNQSAPTEPGPVREGVTAGWVFRNDKTCMTFRRPGFQRGTFSTQCGRLPEFKILPETKTGKHNFLELAGRDAGKK